MIEHKASEVRERLRIDYARVEEIHAYLEKEMGYFSENGPELQRTLMAEYYKDPDLNNCLPLVFPEAKSYIWLLRDTRRLLLASLLISAMLLVSSFFTGNWHYPAIGLAAAILFGYFHLKFGRRYFSLAIAYKEAISSEGDNQS